MRLPLAHRADPVVPQTLGALRARRQSHLVARAMLHPPMDPHQFYCRCCGEPLEGLYLDQTDHIRCDGCGVYTPIPPRAAGELRRRRRRRWGRRPRRVLGDIVVVVYLLIAVLLLLAAL